MCFSFLSFQKLRFDGIPIGFARNGMWENFDHFLFHRNCTKRKLFLCNVCVCARVWNDNRVIFVSFTCLYTWTFACSVQHYSIFVPSSFIFYQCSARTAKSIHNTWIKYNYARSLFLTSLCVRLCVPVCMMSANARFSACIHWMPFIRLANFRENHFTLSSPIQNGNEHRMPAHNSIERNLFENDKHKTEFFHQNSSLNIDAHSLSLSIRFK